MTVHYIWSNCCMIMIYTKLKTREIDNGYYIHNLLLLKRYNDPAFGTLSSAKNPEVDSTELTQAIGHSFNYADN